MEYSNAYIKSAIVKGINMVKCRSGPRGEGSSIMTVPGDVPSAGVYFFGLLVKPWAYFLVILINFSLGKGMLFWQIWSKKCQTSIIPVKKLKLLSILMQRMRKFGKFCLENASTWHF